MSIFKIINWLFPKSYFRIKSKGGSIGENVLIAYPFEISHSKKTRKGRLTIGNNVLIDERMRISMVDMHKKRQYNSLLNIGNNCTFGKDLMISCCNNIKIGEKLLTSARVLIVDSIHEYEDIKIPPVDQPLKSIGKVTIGKNCFIGINACIISCSLGDHVIIGANAVVTRDIPSYSVATGIPARVIKRYNFTTKKWEKVKK
ncbi:MAG: hypothetical protein A2233_03810 [Candidatus Kerfeldbacteria bacterium RIFOXYA2_FULL_38_24]|nr:MAG: hypothetical protein A2233_03810 [Candidatus Kerfeldbacteria bacterium RIFOXYA2_FULL_38_24]